MTPAANRAMSCRAPVSLLTAMQQASTVDLSTASMSSSTSRVPSARGMISTTVKPCSFSARMGSCTLGCSNPVTTILLPHGPQNGQVVAFGAGGGEIQFLGLAAQRFGHLGPGRAQRPMGQHRRVVQAGRVGPVVQHGRVDGIGHGGIHHGGGGIVKIMQVSVKTHG